METVETAHSPEIYTMYGKNNFHNKPVALQTHPELLMDD